ncbi:glycosyltransferase family 2 protein [Flavobacterium crassostreae]|uniref:Glycosyl transferase n=1 Tax=Flavobacterium crassostreae TaxID=1763534 RepID=A0A1B9E5S7_9FLAO|nr:glycosyltransferase family 2 protein [Flavobacterium crassostreae]OCB77218.1 glycosyl transferase [Flavobacterium crassostreae]
MLSNQKEILVSILTPTYNSEKFVSLAIASVQAQSYSNWELIIVDDASTDGTLALVTKHAQVDPRIQVHALTQNSGTGIARSKALAVAKGQYIAFLDADDLWQPTKLLKQVAFMQTHQLPFTFSYYDCIDEQGRPLNKRVTSPRVVSYRALFFCNYIGNLTALYDAEYFGKIPISSVRKRQDWMLWLHILQKIKTAHPVPESLAYYRIRNHSVSTSKFNLLQYNFAVYRQFHGLNFVASLLCMQLFLFVQLAIKPFYTHKIKA